MCSRAQQVAQGMWHWAWRGPAALVLGGADWDTRKAKHWGAIPQISKAWEQYLRGMPTGEGLVAAGVCV